MLIRYYRDTRNSIQSFVRFQAAKLMDSRDDKAADVKSSDADAEGDNEDDKPMDDSPTSNDGDAEESTSTTQNADTKSSGKICYEAV